MESALGFPVPMRTTPEKSMKRLIMTFATRLVAMVMPHQWRRRRVN
ncbi:MAG: hypothetical protein OXC62_06095 [Aestuariivita sp.]|nr:hypothetical protein [Aestuariivita sp.]